MGAACAGGEVVLATAPSGEGPEALCDYSGPGPWFACHPAAEVGPRLAKTGVASSEPGTLPRLLEQAAARKGDRPALLVERPLPPLIDGKTSPPPLPREEWTTWTFAEYLKEVRGAAKGFVQLGFQAFDTVNIWGFNAPEWHMSAMAAGFAGGKCGGLYPTDTPEAAAFKVVHSGGAVVVLEDRAKLEKLVPALSARGDCKRLKAFVAYGFDPAPGEAVTVAGCGQVRVMSWRSLLELGEGQGSDREVDQRVAATRPGHCAALIYTSGTTGDPKAVMISHDNISFEAAAVLDVLGPSCGVGTTATEERILSYLPLSHVAGMMVDIVAPLAVTALKTGWQTVFFARPYDLKAGSIKDRLTTARPTMFLGVPLVWEKIADRIRAQGAEGSNVQKAIAGWAKGLALERARNTQLGGSGQAPCGHGAAMLLLSKVKAKLGLDACKYGLTGAAPIRADTLEYFGSLGLQINEVYGMSECGGATTISTDQAHQWGSCGWELPGVEVKAFQVDPEDVNKKVECPRAPGLDSTDEKFQGELCFRGRHVMMGYLANPDLGTAHVKDIEKKTAETIDKEGWLHSGDKGMITEQGMTKITGRYKELIIGEGGENIAPVPIEDEVKRSCDGIAEVMMVGDKRKYNVALVTLKAVGANGEVPGTDVLDAGAKRVNPQVTTITQAMDDQVWIDAVTAAINAANRNGKCCPNNAFKIQKFTILPTNFSEEKGELTPTKKMKRKAVETAYAKMIDKLYQTNGTYIRFEA